MKISFILLLPILLVTLFFYTSFIHSLPVKDDGNEVVDSLKKSRFSWIRETNDNFVSTSDKTNGGSDPNVNRLIKKASALVLKEMYHKSMRERLELSAEKLQQDRKSYTNNPPSPQPQRKLQLKASLNSIRNKWNQEQQQQQYHQQQQERPHLSNNLYEYDHISRGFPGSHLCFTPPNILEKIRRFTSDFQDVSVEEDEDDSFEYDVNFDKLASDFGCNNIDWDEFEDRVLKNLLTTDHGDHERAAQLS